MKHAIFKGCATAIVTPFTSNGIDFDAFGRLIERQIESGINALVVCGTTGEASTMSHSEKAEAIEFAVKQVDSRVPVIAGTGSNSTETAVLQATQAEDLGVDAVLVVTPYYNKATHH